MPAIVRLLLLVVLSFAPTAARCETSDFGGPLDGTVDSIPKEWLDALKTEDDAFHKTVAHGSDGGYSWDLADRMTAFLHLYLSTDNPYWLKRLTDLGEAMLSQRDSLLTPKLKNYQGQSRLTWSFYYPKSDKWYDQSAFGASVFAPLLRFAILVKERPALQALKVNGETFAQKADRYGKEFKETFLPILMEERRWSKDKGTWMVENDASVVADLAAAAGQPVPVNIGGLDALALYYYSVYARAIGDTAAAEKYLPFVRAQANYARSQFGQPMKTDANPLSHYEFQYATYKGGTRPEDAGHFNYDLLWAYLMYRAGILTSTEIKTLANTAAGLVAVVNGEAKMPYWWINNTSPVPDTRARGVLYISLVSGMSSGLRTRCRMWLDARLDSKNITRELAAMIYAQWMDRHD